MKNFRMRRPLLVDSSMNTALAISYFIFALFGLAGFIVGVPAIESAAGSFVSHTLSAIIALLGFASGIATLHSMLSPHWERWEFYLTASMLVFIMAYIGTLFVVTLHGNGDDRLSQFILSTALLVMPTWKLSFIIKRNK